MGFSQSLLPLTGLAIMSLMIIIALSPERSNALISCPQVLEYLMPCQPFLMGTTNISPPCCLGAQALSAVAASGADRKSVCQCLKQIASTVNIDQDKAKQLPQLCNITVPVPIQLNVDCDSLEMGEMKFRYKELRPTTPAGDSPGIGHPP